MTQDRAVDVADVEPVEAVECVLLGQRTTDRVMGMCYSNSQAESPGHT
jgi:hypothetical protein